MKKEDMTNENAITVLKFELEATKVEEPERPTLIRALEMAIEALKK